MSGPIPDGADVDAADRSNHVATDDGQPIVQQLRDGLVPRRLDRAAAIGWRVLVLVAAVVVGGYIVSELRVVFVPLVLGLFLAAVLAPPANWLRERRWPPLLATWTVILAASALVALVVLALAPSVGNALDGMGEDLGAAYAEISDWLVEGPVGLDRATIEDFEDEALARAREYFSTGLASRATFLVELVTGFVLTLVIGFFYVKDGPRFRSAFLDHIPEDRRDRMATALRAGWNVLQRYLVGVVVVGAVDAAVIGIGLALIGVPFVIPLMVLTFLAAFFPLVGAIFAGAVASLMALATGGPGDALLVVALSVLVQQVDGDVVAPLVFSRAVSLHPLAVLLALTTGAVIAGIIGAFIAVPALAVVLAMRRAWRADEASPHAVPPSGMAAADQS